MKVHLDTSYQSCSCLVAITIKNKHIYIQGINLKDGHIIVSVSSLDHFFTNEYILRSNRNTALFLGYIFSNHLVDLGISSVVVDGSKYRYHGKYKEIINQFFLKGIKCHVY